MRCSCMQCGEYMVHDAHHARCVCPECGNTCDVCNGGRNIGRIERERSGVDVPVEWIAKYGEKKK